MNKFKLARKISVIILLSLLFTYCSKIDELTHFDVDYDYTFTLPALYGLPLPGDIQSPSVENDTESIFENNDTRKDRIERATLKQFTIKIIEPEDGSFNVLKNINIYINADGEDELLIAWKHDIPNDIGNYIELDVTSKNLKNYLISDKIKIRFKSNSNKGISEDHKIDVKSTVEVDAKILGI